MKIMITGHRPHRIGGYDSDNKTRQYVRKKIREILQAYKELDDDIIGISGMALGADQDFCEVCIELGIPYLAYVPFEGQESVWPDPAKKKYQNLLDQAKETTVVSKGSYSPKKMQIRNIAMADACDIAIAVWDGTAGGTANCYKYLEKLDKSILRIDPKDAAKDSTIHEKGDIKSP